MINVILLNGPPRSGKTEIANHLQRIHAYWVYNFADPLKDAQKVFFPLFDYEEFKEKELTRTCTGRDFIIQLAEDFIKPRFTKSFFANNVCDRITMDIMTHGEQNIVIGDLGFAIEYSTVHSRLNKLTASLNASINIELWHILRNGTNFAQDSRKYVDTPTRTVYNETSLPDLHQQVTDIVAARS